MRQMLDEIVLDVSWEQWVALGERGRSWLRMVATGSEPRPDGGHRVRMADYRLPEFVQFLETLQ